MQIIHLDLKTIQADRVELRCFTDNPYQYDPRPLALSEIQPFLHQAEQGYYAASHKPLDLTAPGRQFELVRPGEEFGAGAADDWLANLITIGRRLFQWLDGSDRWLVNQLSQAMGKEVVLAIAATEQLANLPWEVLHDGAQFLVQRQPAVVPVRWLASDGVPQLTPVSQPRNRALNVLLMATSPLDVTPVLNYEQEEAQILKATTRFGIGLTVEESGCLAELRDLVASQPRDAFDVVHLTGHATIQEGQPKFITETATGTAYYASAVEIARSLRTPLPPLVFLSGCRTAQAANQGAVPSMAAELLRYGATAVLGWGQTVLDTDATAAAAALYGSLSRSDGLITAVGETYQTLIQQKARDWHLLRLYVANTLPDALVTPVRTPGRKAAPKPSMATEFLDPVTQTIKVPTRESFVGRRRQLQQCIRALTVSQDYLAVLIHGMGGLGKSSLAARLCDRLTQFQRQVWQGRIDPPSLVKRLAEALDDADLRQQLQNPAEELRFRLRTVFRALTEQGKPPLLLVLDDFEQNLEAVDGSYRLLPPALEVLNALMFALEDGSTGHRLMFTSRYDFESSYTARIYKQPLDGLQGADLQKKCEQLTLLKPPPPPSTPSEGTLPDQARQLADGNPRLLETLEARLTQPTTDPTTELAQLIADPTPLRQKVLEDRVLHQINASLQTMLSRGLVFELPVPEAAFATVTQSHDHLEQAIALGLLEVSPDATLRVPRILPLHLPDPPDALYADGAQTLYQDWWPKCTEEQALEVLRLALLANAGEIAAEITEHLAVRLRNTSHFRAAVALCEATLAIIESHKVLGQLAYCKQVLGDVGQADAYYQRAIEICPDDDAGRQAHIFHDLGMLKDQQGQVQEAINLYQQSLALYELIGNVQGKAASLHGMAIIYAQQGQVQEAMALHQQSLTLYESIGNVQGKAASLHGMAMIYAQQGQVQEAIALHQQSLVFTELIGDVRGKAATLNQIANIYTQQGQVEQAMALYQNSLALKESIGDVRGKAVTLHQMANIYTQQGQVEQAMVLYQQSLVFTELIGDVRGKAASLRQLADIYAQQGQMRQAVELYQQVLTIDESIGDVRGKAVTLHQMANIYTQSGQMEQSMDLYQQSMVLYKSIGDVQGKAATLHDMAGIYVQQGRVNQALELYQKSLTEEESIGNVKGKAATLHEMAIIYSQQGQVNQAIDLFQQSLGINEKIGNVHGKAMTLSWLGGLANERGDVALALPYLQEAFEILQRLQSPEAQKVAALIEQIQQPTG